MATIRLLMRQIREILRLKFEARLTHRAISKTCGVGVGTISLYLKRMEEAKLGWPLPEDLDDVGLESRLFRQPGRPCRHPKPDLKMIHQELKKPGVTLYLLWQEYSQDHPAGYSYSQFCEICNQWSKKLKPSMRQRHPAGKNTFVDYSGKRPHIVNRQTGEQIPVELFVAVLGASNFTYAEVTESQDLPCWIGSHIRMAEYFGGSSEIWVPDNLKSGITRPCRYEPGVNRTYRAAAEHYGAVVIPARTYKPKDKAKVETAVLVVQRWILARLRNLTFFSIAELNAAIRELLKELNDRPMQKLGVSRRELFEQLDRPVLQPLPNERYQISEWRKCRVNIDYHVEVDHNFYSVPYQLVHERVEACFSSSVVEVYLKDRRVASHRRLNGRGNFRTLPEHMPAAHRAHAEWTPSRLINWAETTGPAAGRLVAGILRSRPHPEQGYRACLGIMRLGKRYGQKRLEAACARAEWLRSYKYRTVKNILTSEQDRLPFEEESPSSQPTPHHDNIRGADYYDGKEMPC